MMPPRCHPPKTASADTTPVQVLLAFSNRNSVVHACDPALAVIEIGQTFLCGQIVAVLRPRRVAADLGLVVDALTEGISAQEIETVGRLFLGLELKRMVSGVPAIHDRSEPAVLWIGACVLIERRAWRGNLVSVDQRLQVGSFAAHICGSNQNIAR